MNVAFLLALAMSATLGDGPDGLKVPGKSLPEAKPPESALVPKKPGSGTVPTGSELILSFAYGSEKKGWIEEVTRAYNEAHHTLSDGRGIRIETLPMGSGEIIDRLLKPEGDPSRLQAHIVSPASAAFVTIGNGESREMIGKELVGETQDLVRSPLVLALWSDLADACHWQTAPPSWSEVFGAVGDPGKWKLATEGKAGIPALRLGHTDPERSNSGLLALILMVESASKVDRSFEGGLTRAAVRDPAIAQMLKATELGVVQPLNSSTGFLADSMLKEGRTGMGAALMYESLVIEKNRAFPGPPRLIAIYPKEGVFANEHPIGIVKRDWVTDSHAEASRDYVAYLLARPQQEKAKGHGFRPADSTIPIDDLIKPEFGVNVVNTPPLAYPNSQLIKEIRATWQTIISPTSPTR